MTFCLLPYDIIPSHTLNDLIMFSVQRDGFIVPIHGSLINSKPKNNLNVYKTTKKRWLETFIQEGGSTKCPSPGVSPKHVYSPTRENNSQDKEVLNSSLPQQQVNITPTSLYCLIV